MVETSKPKGICEDVLVLYEMNMLFYTLLTLQLSLHAEADDELSHWIQKSDIFLQLEP